MRPSGTNTTNSRAQFGYQPVSLAGSPENRTGFRFGWPRATPPRCRYFSHFVWVVPRQEWLIAAISETGQSAATPAGASTAAVALMIGLMNASTYVAKFLVVNNVRSRYEHGSSLRRRRFYIDLWPDLAHLNWFELNWIKNYKYFEFILFWIIIQWEWIHLYPRQPLWNFQITLAA